MSKLKPVFTVQLTRDEILILNALLHYENATQSVIDLGRDSTKLFHLQQVFELKSEMLYMDLLEPYRYVEISEE